MHHHHVLRLAATTTLLFVSQAISGSTPGGSKPTDAVPFSPGFDIDAVITLAESLPSHSWEFGTASEALLELYDAAHSVFGDKPFPVPTLNPSKSPSLTYAKEKIVIGVPPNGLSDGDGAVGDPASLGVYAVLLGKTDASYTAAAKAEAEYVVSEAPRFWNGAISHRAAISELWADFIYMAPPFLAYYGVASNNATFLRTAVEQCILYRQILIANTTSTGPATPPSTHPSSAQGLWTHILGPQSTDPGIWSTGNAWAAAGAMRVLATLVKAPPSLFNNKLSSSLPNVVWREQAIASLVGLIRELLDGAMRQTTDEGLLKNYLDDPTWFGEISGSSLLASVAYRLSTISHLLGSSALSSPALNGYVSWAEGIRKILGNGQHVVNGTATPAINPLNWGDRNPFETGSPEGNNFVVLLYSAWRDCVKAGVRGCKRI